MFIDERRVIFLKIILYMYICITILLVWSFNYFETFYGLFRWYWNCRLGFVFCVGLGNLL